MNNARSWPHITLSTSLGALLIPVWLMLSALPAYTQNSRNTEQEHSIREAIVRYQIEKWELSKEVVFIEINGKDPSDEFLKRFVDLNVPVRKKSASSRTKDALSWVIEKKTHKRGVIFDQGAIQWESKERAVVDGGYQCADLCDASGSYDLEFLDGKWIVKGFSVRLIS